MYSSSETAVNYLSVGQGKTVLPILKMLILGVFAGIFIAFAGVGATISTVTVESASLAKLISALVFPAGLAMVVLTGSELFTGNNLLIIPVLEHKATFGGMFRNWIVVYIGNFIGSILVALAVVYGHTLSLFGGQAAEAVVSVAVTKTSLSFTDALIRGILCNVLVCIAVWAAMCAKDISGKILALYFPIMIFVVCGFEHSVANMYYISAGLFAISEYSIAADSLTWSSFLFGNLIPVTLGNIIGGAGIVGYGFWVAFLRKGKK